MPKVEAIEGLSDERALVLRALQSLRRDRALVWNIACDIAEQDETKRPTIESYGIPEIELLARRFGFGRHATAPDA
jgi:hypothetical protein